MKFSALDKQKHEDDRRKRAYDLFVKVSNINYYHKGTLTGIMESINNLTIAVLLAADLVGFPIEDD
jgi:hypothetical protein